jgi:hypothetical protein
MAIGINVVSGLRIHFSWQIEKHLFSGVNLYRLNLQFLLINPILLPPDAEEIAVASLLPSRVDFIAGER